MMVAGWLTRVMLAQCCCCCCCVCLRDTEQVRAWHSKWLKPHLLPSVAVGPSCLHHGFVRSMLIELNQQTQPTQCLCVCLCRSAVFDSYQLYELLGGSQRTMCLVQEQQHVYRHHGTESAAMRRSAASLLQWFVSSVCVFERESVSRYRYNSFDRQINARTLRRVRVVSSVIRAAGAWATSFNTVLRAMHQHRLIPPNATRGSMRTARVRSGSVAWASDREDLTIVHMCVRACVLALQCVTNSMSASRVRLTRPTNRARMPRSSQGSTASGANGPTSTS